MASYSSDRRSLLKIFGAVGTACAYPFASDELFGQTAEAASPRKRQPEPEDPTALFQSRLISQRSRALST